MSGRYCKRERKIKRASSSWIKEREPTLRDFVWQSGYGAFSVSASTIDSVRAYIDGQVEYHWKQPFQDKYPLILRSLSAAGDDSLYSSGDICFRASQFFARNQSSRRSVLCNIAHSITNPKTRGGRFPSITLMVPISICACFSPYTA